MDQTSTVQDQPSSSTKVCKRKDRFIRSYNREKRVTYYKKLKSLQEVKLYEYINWGPLKNILTLKDKYGTTWFLTAHVYKSICGKSFRFVTKGNAAFSDYMKLFSEIELPPITENLTTTHLKSTHPLVYERNSSVKKNTMFINELGLPLFINTFSQSKSTDTYPTDSNNGNPPVQPLRDQVASSEMSEIEKLFDIEQYPPVQQPSREQVASSEMSEIEQLNSVYKHTTVDPFKNIGTIKDLNNTYWFNLSDIIYELKDTKSNREEISDDQSVLLLKNIPLDAPQKKVLINHIRYKTYFVNETKLNTLGRKLILLANHGTVPMSDQQSQTEPSTSTFVPQEQELSIATPATFVQKQLSTLCDQYIQHITNPLIPFSVLPVLEYSQNLHAITDRSNEDDEEQRPEEENEEEETGNDEPHSPPSREDQDNEQQQIVVKYQREDCRYEHVIPRTYEGDTGFFILLRINHRPGAYYVLRAQYKSLPGRFSILNKDLQRFPLGLTELLRIVTANPMRLLGHVAKRYESKVRRSHVTILELIESEDEQTEPSWTEEILLEKIQALHEELVMTIDDVTKRTL